MSSLEAGHPFVAHRRGRRALAALAGCAMAGAVLASGLAATWPLPILGWAAAFVLLAVERDVAAHRVPNWLTLPGVAIGFGWGFLAVGLDGLVLALLGCALAFGFFVVPYAVGALGAGDVKAAMALGALFGPALTLRFALVAIVTGGVLGVLRLAAAGALSELAGRWVRSVGASLVARRPIYLPPPPESPAAAGIPFAVALAAGLAISLSLEVLA